VIGEQQKSADDARLMPGEPPVPTLPPRSEAPSLPEPGAAQQPAGQ